MLLDSNKYINKKCPKIYVLVWHCVALSERQTDVQRPRTDVRRTQTAASHREDASGSFPRQVTNTCNYRRDGEGGDMPGKEELPILRLEAPGLRHFLSSLLCPSSSATVAASPGSSRRSVPPPCFARRVPGAQALLTES